MSSLYNIRETDLHLWYIFIDVSAALSLLFAVLSEDEQQRVNSFHFEQL